MSGSGGKTRAIAVIGLGLVAGALFFAYEELRRARENDFPFLFEPLFLHGLLLLALAVVVVLMIKFALEGNALTAWLVVLVLAAPSAVLAVAPFIIARLGWDFFPDRLVGDGFHQLGMAGVGLALGVILARLRRDRSEAVSSAP